MQTRLVAGAVFLALMLAAWGLHVGLRAPAPIRIGFLHSQSGPLADAESALIDAERMAVEEINARGGLLGRPVEAVVADGQSDPETFARLAGRLILKERVSVLVGGGSAAARRLMKPVVEAENHLLISPTPHEGLELSEHILYVGAVINQRIVPAVTWSLLNLGKRFYLVGADEIGSHVVHAVVRDQVKALGGEVVGDAFVGAGSGNVQGAVDGLAQAKADVVLSSLVGASHGSFYHALRRFGGKRPPVMALGSGEHELRHVRPEDRAGDYVAASYLQNIERGENRGFLDRFRKRYGANRLSSDAIQAAYVSVWLWAQSVNEAGTDAVAAVRKKILGQSRGAPEGVVSIDPATRHAWRSFSIGRWMSDGSLDVVWTAGKPIRPLPFPATRSRTEWDAFLLDRFSGWGGAWANPVHPKW